MDARAGRGGSRPLARLAMVGSGACFGLMAVLARLLSHGPAHFTAGQLTVVRFVFGAAASLAYFRLRPGTYRPVNRRLLFSRGLSGGLVVVLYFSALARIPAGEASLLYNLFPVVATVMSFFAFGERPTAHLLVALGVATAGVGLVLSGDPGAARLGRGLGELLALGAAFFAATSAVVIRAMRATDNAPTIFFWFCLGGMPVALPFALSAWPVGLPAWLAAAALGAVSMAAQVLMTEAYGTLSVAEAAVWLQLTPLATYLLAVPLLGERPTALGLTGVVVGVAGVAYASVLGHVPAGQAGVRPPVDAA
ncbi:MAG TPA: DMT family transporter [Anaeromyxobacteraceae bacterium]|jgi:drug/metabolite transporter (DMT)-like permease|nr:DMT family transporter [Anaeromyxobacteraceae bacterium]